MSTARARLTPLDLSLKHSRAYTWARRGVLGLSLALTVAFPVWHLHALGKATPPVVGGVGSVDVFGLELFDPLWFLSVGAAHGFTAALALVALPAVLMVLVLGRFFCGWVCPYVPVIAASHGARWLLTRWGFSPLDLQVPRVVGRVLLVGLLAATALTGTQLLPFVYPPSVIGREAFRAVFYGGLSAGALVVGAAFLFDTFISRAGFCRSLCPGGALFSALSFASPFTVRLEKSKCTDCTACDVVCNLGQSPMTGRIDPGCERCGKCVAVCPTDALKLGMRR